MLKSQFTRQRARTGSYEMPVGAYHAPVPGPGIRGLIWSRHVGGAFGTSGQAGSPEWGGNLLLPYCLPMSAKTRQASRNVGDAVVGGLALGYRLLDLDWIPPHRANSKPHAGVRELPATAGETARAPADKRPRSIWQLSYPKSTFARRREVEDLSVGLRWQGNQPIRVVNLCGFRPNLSRAMTIFRARI